MNRCFTLLLFCATGLLFSCSQPVPAPEKTPAPIYVGRVEHVYPEHNYALLVVQGRPLEDGTVLISQSDGTDGEQRVANLIVSSERLGRRRIPADIRSGSVKPGDQVFLYRNLARPNVKDNPDISTDSDVTDSPESPSNTDAPPPDITPTGKDVGPDGLVPLPGQSTVPTANTTKMDKEAEERARQERENILRQLENIPEHME